MEVATCPQAKVHNGCNGHDRHLINPDVEPLDVHLSLLASVFAHLQLVPELGGDVENTLGNKQSLLLLLAHFQFVHDLNTILQCTEVFRLCDCQDQGHDHGHLNSRISSSSSL